MTSKEAELEKVRQRFLDRKGTVRKDPTEFQMPRKESLPKDGSSKIYRFHFLPPISMGEKVLNGDKVVEATEDLFWCIEHGSHWIDGRYHACPRIISGGDDHCPICEIAFDLFKNTEDKKKRSQIAKAYLPNSRWATNVYFLDDPRNPEELRGQVRWMNINKTIFDKCESCVMNDDPGDELDQKPCGLFYDLDEGYVFQLEVRLKEGYQNYENSRFLVKTKGSMKNIDVLEKRQLISAKVPRVDVEKLNAIANRLSGGGESEEEPVANTEAVAQGVGDRPKPAAQDVNEAPKAPKAPKAPEPKESSPSDATKAQPENKPEDKPEASSAPAPKAAATESADDEDPELAALLAELDDAEK